MEKWIILIPLFFLALAGCHTRSEGSSPVTAVDSAAVFSFPPHFVATNYIDLDKIGRVSKFRSSVGHDYHDDFEQCRSMKHYFEPKENIDWSAIKIIAPVGGTVSRMIEEWAGTQVQIESKAYPSLYFIIFHINLRKALAVGDTIQEGDTLGTHIGSQTMSDIAVGVASDSGWALISYFDVMTDSLFQQYRSKGAGTREDFIISKEARDADTLHCSGDTFLKEGSIADWVTLK
ncbi:MAG TPA: hypothetical protein VMM58_02265 [Bacteroidota bacterium]|nr:hypothetical protein [Bacteroidota bacterium]